MLSIFDFYQFVAVSFFIAVTILIDFMRFSMKQMFEAKKINSVNIERDDGFRDEFIGWKRFFRLSTWHRLLREFLSPYYYNIDAVEEYV